MVFGEDRATAPAILKRLGDVKAKLKGCNGFTARRGRIGSQTHTAPLAILGIADTK